MGFVREAVTSPGQGSQTCRHPNYLHDTELQGTVGPDSLLCHSSLIPVIQERLSQFRGERQVPSESVPENSPAVLSGKHGRNSDVQTADS